MGGKTNSAEITSSYYKQLQASRLVFKILKVSHLTTGTHHYENMLQRILVYYSFTARCTLDTLDGVNVKNATIYFGSHTFLPVLAFERKMASTKFSTNHGYRNSPCKDTICSLVVHILLQLFPIETELHHQRRLALKCSLDISCHKYKQ